MATTLVFDLDGTLTDPAEGIVNCFVHALVEFGYPAAERDAICEGIGPPLDTNFKRLTGETDEARINELVVCYRERYNVSGYAENTMYPGIPEALETLADRGVRLGVCTSKRVDFAERILEMFELRHFFDFVDGGDVGITKASQLGGLLATGAIDARAVMIGDRAIDIESASANGLAGVGVLWGFGDRAELEAASPVRIVATVAELTELAPAQ